MRPYLDTAASMAEVMIDAGAVISSSMRCALGAAFMEAGNLERLRDVAITVWPLESTIWERCRPNPEFAPVMNHMGEAVVVIFGEAGDLEIFGNIASKIYDELID